MTLESARTRRWLVDGATLLGVVVVACGPAAPEPALTESRAEDRTPAAAVAERATRASPAAPAESDDGALESYEAPDTPFDDFHDEVLCVAGPVTPPRKIAWAPPAYPGGELRAIEGRVVLESILGKGGTIQRVRVKRSLHTGFDRVSKQALESWRFEPARLAGRPVNVYYNLTVNFRHAPKPSSAPPARR